MQLIHYPTSLLRGTSDFKGGMARLTPALWPIAMKTATNLRMIARASSAN
jgi:hypothetical protein